MRICPIFLRSDLATVTDAYFTRAMAGRELAAVKAKIERGLDLILSGMADPEQ